MKQEIFQNKQKALTDDFILAQSTKEDAVRERLTDIFSPGVLTDSHLIPGETVAFEITDATSGGVPMITVKSGVAFSPIGERIVISSLTAFDAAAPTTLTPNGHGAGTTLTPLSTGSVSVPLTPSSDNYIWLGYLKTTDISVYTLAKDPTDLKLFTKADDGFKVSVTTTTDDPDSPTTNTVWVLAGKVVAGLNTVTSISITGANRTVSKSLAFRVGIDVPSGTGSRPSTYALGESKVLDDHINSIGSGTVAPTNPHGTDFADVDGQIVQAQIGDQAVGTDQVEDGSITAVKIGFDLNIESFIRFYVQGDAVALGDTAIVKALSNKSGSIEEFMMYVDTIPQGAGGGGLELDIRKNGVTSGESIFTTKPKISNGRTANAGTGLLMTITTSAPSGVDIGQINSSLNAVAVGDRVSLHITEIGDSTAGGADILILMIIP